MRSAPTRAGSTPPPTWKATTPPELQGEENYEARLRRNFQLYMRDYLQTVQAIDDSTGRVLEALDRHGMSEDTIIVYTSDQGFFLGDHGWYDKRLMFDESLQMPMMVRWPDAMYYRYWEHEDPDHRAPAHYGIRTRTHKLIHFYGDGLGAPGASDAVREGEWEMYDLVSDPAELHNIAEDPAHAEVRARLEKRMAALQAQLGDRPYDGPDTPRPDWGRMG